MSKFYSNTCLRVKDVRQRNVVKHRVRTKRPSYETTLRVKWMTWLVEKYGADRIGTCQAPPVSFSQWKADQGFITIADF